MSAVATVAVSAAVGLATYGAFHGGASTAAGAARGGSAASACGASQLSAVAGLGGATMSELGSVTLTNTADSACSLPSTSPRVQIVVGRRALSVRQQPWAQSSAAKSFPSQPVRVLQPGQSAAIGLQWRNWCGGFQPADGFVLHFGNGLHVVARAAQAVEPPVCAAPGYGSWLNASRPYRSAV
jgi:hypothetical protein